MSMTKTQFVSQVINALDATGIDANLAASTTTPRWDSTTILVVGSNVMSEEWGNILNQNADYRFNSVSVTTDSSGRIAIADLTTGSGDTKKNFYRVLSGPTDGNVLYRQTDFRNVPLATISNYNSPWDYLYYLSGSDYFQCLPVASGTALTVVVNWTPPVVNDLSAGSVVLDYPTNSEMVLVWRTAAKLLIGKGGDESGAAAALDALADDARVQLLGSIARLTTRPTALGFQDLAMHWGGG